VVDHTPYDTASIAASIERRFDLPPLSSRDAAAHDLSSVFHAESTARAVYAGRPMPTASPRRGVPHWPTRTGRSGTRLAWFVPLGSSLPAIGRLSYVPATVLDGFGEVRSPDAETRPPQDHRSSRGGVA
jgi:hypothetical protein